MRDSSERCDGANAVEQSAMKPSAYLRHEEGGELERLEDLAIFTGA